MRVRTLFTAGALLLGGAAIAAIGVGSVAIPPTEVVGILLQQIGVGAEPAASAGSTAIVTELRLPRILLASLVTRLLRQRSAAGRNIVWRIVISALLMLALAWLLNNPGNLRPGGKYVSMIGQADTASGKFAIFSSAEEGRKEKRALLRRKYNDMTLYNAMHTYAPEGENDTAPMDYEPPKGKFLLYWGCSETVRPGQPKVLNLETATLAEFGKFLESRRATGADIR